MELEHLGIIFSFLLFPLLLLGFGLVLALLQREGGGEDKEKLLEEEDSLRAVWLILVTIFAFLAVFLVINMAIFLLL